MDNTTLIILIILVILLGGGGWYVIGNVVHILRVTPGPERDGRFAGERAYFNDGC